MPSSDPRIMNSANKARSVVALLVGVAKFHFVHGASASSGTGISSAGTTGLQGHPGASLTSSGKKLAGRCGPSFADASCGVDSCCSPFGWCGSGPSWCSCEQGKYSNIMAVRFSCIASLF